MCVDFYVEAKLGQFNLKLLVGVLGGLVSYTTYSRSGQVEKDTKSGKWRCTDDLGHCYMENVSLAL